jgi:hypothetical protein
LNEVVEAINALTVEMAACNPRNYPIKPETLGRWTQDLVRVGETITSLSTEISDEDIRLEDDSFDGSAV